MARAAGTRMALFRNDPLATASELFDVVRAGAVKMEVQQTYPLYEAAQAHRDIESGTTTGMSVLIP